MGLGACDTINLLVTSHLLSFRPLTTCLGDSVSWFAVPHHHMSHQHPPTLNRHSPTGPAKRNKKCRRQAQWHPHPRNSSCALIVVVQPSGSHTQGISMKHPGKFKKKSCCKSLTFLGKFTSFLNVCKSLEVWLRFSGRVSKIFMHSH